jgi:hypothetical protein
MRLGREEGEEGETYTAIRHATMRTFVRLGAKKLPAAVVNAMVVRDPNRRQTGPQKPIRIVAQHSALSGEHSVGWNGDDKAL